MTRPGMRQVGAFVRHQAPELTRIWRVARNAERRTVFPGLLDGIVESFLVAAGTLLESNGAPEDAIERALGIIRWPPALAPAELSAEWRLLADVLATACESVNCEPGCAEWLSRAVAAADGACIAADGGRGPLPARAVLVLVRSAAAPIDREAV